MNATTYTMEDLMTCVRDLFYMSQTMSDNAVSKKFQTAESVVFM